MVDLIWDKCIPHLERVIEKAPNDISLESMKSNLLETKTLMVTISEGTEVIAVNIMETCTYETGYKVLFIPITGGDRMNEWLADFLKIAHQIARDYGCAELRGISARKGWVKALNSAEQDWKVIHEVIGCQVEQVQTNITKFKGTGGQA